MCTLGGPLHLLQEDQDPGFLGLHSELSRVWWGGDWSAGWSRETQQGPGAELAGMFGFCQLAGEEVGA